MEKQIPPKPTFIDCTPGPRTVGNGESNWPIIFIVGIFGLLFLMVMFTYFYQLGMNSCSMPVMLDIVGFDTSAPALMSKFALGEL